jgi:hypothetical protein
MCGKAIPASDDTYVHDAELKKGFIKLSNVLRLLPKIAANSSNNMKQALDTMMQSLRSLVEDKLKEQDLMKKTKPIDWQEIYEQLLPEEQRKEKVKFS